MSRSTLGPRIVGAVVGLVAGGVPLGLLIGYIMWSRQYSNGLDAIAASFFFGGLGFLTGATLGAAAGATLTQRLMKRRSHFWRAWLGALALLLLGTVLYLPFAMNAIADYYHKAGSPGLLPLLAPHLFFGTIFFSPVTVVTGAVIGSGRKVETTPLSVKPGGSLPPG